MLGLLFMFEFPVISAESPASTDLHSLYVLLLAIHTLELCVYDHSLLLVLLGVFLHVLQLLDCLLIQVVYFLLVEIALRGVVLDQGLVLLLGLQLLSHCHHVFQSTVIIESKIDIHKIILVLINYTSLWVNFLILTMLLAMVDNPLLL